MAMKNGHILSLHPPCLSPNWWNKWCFNCSCFSFGVFVSPPGWEIDCAPCLRSVAVCAPSCHRDMGLHERLWCNLSNFRINEVVWSELGKTATMEYKITPFVIRQTVCGGFVWVEQRQFRVGCAVTEGNYFVWAVIVSGQMPVEKKDLVRNWTGS